MARQRRLCPSGVLSFACPITFTSTAPRALSRSYERYSLIALRLTAQPLTAPTDSRPPPPPPAAALLAFYRHGDITAPHFPVGCWPQARAVAICDKRAELTPRLSRLELVDFEPRAAFSEILCCTPAGLRYLALRSGANSGSPQPDGDLRGPCTLDQALRRFDHLEHLELCGDSFTPAGLVLHVHTLDTLRTLSFGPGSYVTNQLILNLLDGPLPSSQLAPLGPRPRLLVVRPDTREPGMDAP